MALTTIIIIATRSQGRPVPAELMRARSLKKAARIADLLVPGSRPRARKDEPVTMLLTAREAKLTAQM